MELKAHEKPNLYLIPVQNCLNVISLTVHVYRPRPSERNVASPYRISHGT